MQAQVTYKDRPFRITRNFSKQTVKARGATSEVMQSLREQKTQPKLLLQVKFSFKIDGETKIFQYKAKFKLYISTNPSEDRILKEKENKQTNKQKNLQQNDGTYTKEKTRY